MLDYKFGHPVSSLCLLVGLCLVDSKFLFVVVVIITVIAGMLIHTNRYRTQTMLKANTSGHIIHYLHNNIH